MSLLHAACSRSHSRTGYNRGINVSCTRRQVDGAVWDVKVAQNKDEDHVVIKCVLIYLCVQLVDDKVLRDSLIKLFYYHN